jgi:hypothetical protein
MYGPWRERIDADADGIGIQQTLAVRLSVMPDDRDERYVGLQDNARRISRLQGQRMGRT